MKQTLLLALTAFCIFVTSSSLQAQTYRPGFIVKAEGDTLQGLIKYREGKNRLDIATFKPGESATSQDYTASELLAFGITGDGMFESKQLPDREKPVFVEVVRHGKLNLYDRYDTLYLAKENEALVKLSIQTDDSGLAGAVGDHKIVKTSTSHLILVNSLTYDCPVPQELMEKLATRLRTPHVEAVVNAYNECADPASNISYKEDKPWVSVEKGIMVGSHSYTPEFIGGPRNITEAYFPVGHSMVIGGHFNITTPRRSEKLSFQVDLLYSQESFDGYYEKLGPLITERYDYAVDFKRISGSLMLRNTFMQNKKLSPFIGVGVAHDVTFNGNVVIRREDETKINNIRYIDTSITDDGISVINKTLVDGALALGATYALNENYKLLFQVKYEKGLYVIKDEEEFYSSSEAFMNNTDSFFVTMAYIFR